MSTPALPVDLKIVIGAFLASEIKAWDRTVKDANIKLPN